MNKHSFIATSAAVLLGFAAGFESWSNASPGCGRRSPKVESPCDKDGAFSPKVDKDLLRRDLVIEPAEMQGIPERRSRTPSKTRC